MVKRISIIMVLAALLVIIHGTAQARARAHEIIEVSETVNKKSDPWSSKSKEAKNKKLSKQCKKVAAQYIEVQENMNDWLKDLENTLVVGKLLELKSVIKEKKDMPKECIVELDDTIEHLIRQSFDTKPDQVDWNKVRNAASDMEAELMSTYREFSDYADSVCNECAYRPPELKADPIRCGSDRLQKDRSKRNISCDKALKRYESEKDTLIYKRDMCKQSKLRERLNKILLWFQGRSDIPLTCAVEIKDFIGGLRKPLLHEPKSNHLSNIMQNMCGKGLFPIYKSYGKAASDACRACFKDSPCSLP